MRKLTLKELQTKLFNGEATSVQATQSVLEQIAAQDQQIKAYVSVFKEQALQKAAQADEKLKTGASASLLGIPLSIKDNLDLLGTAMTCGSKIMQSYISSWTARAVQKLQDAGAVIVGKTNLDEFAMGSSTENSALQKTANPWNIEYVPGGSSGGAAASVAADECFGALGSDTGGSLRQPAAFCGVVGLRPTYGAVSRQGLAAFASSLDQIGPIAKTVEDAALLFNVIAGYDENDPTSVNMTHPDYTALLGKDIKGLKIAVIKEPSNAAAQSAIAELKNQGALITEIELPNFQYAPMAYYLISAAEASSNLARFDGVRFGYRSKDFKDSLELYQRSRAEGLGEEVKRRLMIGAYALSAGQYNNYFLKAQKVRTVIIQDYAKVLAQYDAVVSVYGTAFKFGAARDNAFDANDASAVTPALAGLPAVSVPCGLLDGLPVGLQIVTRAFQEQKLLQIASAVERNSKFERLSL